MRFDEYDFAKPYILENERILWQGKPAKGLFITWSDVVATLFGLVWCGLLTRAFCAAPQGDGDSMPIPVFIIMLGLGFSCTIGRVIYGKFIATRTAYVITTNKIIRKRGSKIDTLEKDNRPEMRVVARKDGIGSIRFGYAVRRRGRRGGITIEASESNPGVFSLENISDVAKVQQIIYETE